MTSQAVAEALGGIKASLENQDRALSRIETKSTETNSRVTKLEVLRERDEAVKNYVGERKWHWRGWVFAVVAASGGALGALIGHMAGA